MESICPICKRSYDGVVCTKCTVNNLDVSFLKPSQRLVTARQEERATAYLVDLVTTRRIPITTVRCQVGRDELNDLVIAGDHSMSRYHFLLTEENSQYKVQDLNSRHGTFLNGKELLETEPIFDGDVLKAGASLFWFVIESVKEGAEGRKESLVAHI